MTIDRHVRFACLSALAAAALTAPAAAARVEVTVTGMTSAAGQVVCALYRNPDGFPVDPGKAARLVTAPIAAAAARCVFDDILRGPAAVAVYHDANANQKLDMRFGIIPREALGASNNPKARLGPPRFDAAQFAVDDAPVALNVTLQRP